ncbi:MAG: repair protein RecO [Verrucomicrobiaceae bacterium]|nr:repair protein RecO [Verrucomicrobiaceae bacterium]
MSITESLQSAYLLHSRDYRDTSLIVELFTLQQGRVSAVARGARSVRHGSSQRAILQPFQPLWLEVVGHTDLKSLRQVETRAAAITLRGKSLFGALYLNELLCRLLHRDDANSELFADYENTLQQLSNDNLLDVVLRHFELRLLDALGYGFSLTHVTDSGTEIVPGLLYDFDAQRGLTRNRMANPHAINGSDIIDFLQGIYSPAARRALKQICRQALRPHLGTKPLSSRELFVSDR